MPVLSPWQVADKEMTMYLSQMMIRTTFTYFSTVSKKYLAIRGTSVPSEHIFSKAGFIADQFRELRQISVFSKQLRPIVVRCSYTCNYS